MRKAIYLLALFIMASIKMLGQCPSNHDRADRLINEIKDRVVICSNHFYDPNISSNIFHTKYEFVLNEPEGNCVLDFYYDKINDTIGVKYSNHGIVKTQKIPFDPAGSQLIFKNFQANQPVVKNEYCHMLFTVFNPNQPYVSLNHFELFDNENVIYYLNPISDYDLANHNATVVAYRSKNLPQPVVDNNQETHNKNIDSFLDSMEKYRASIMVQKQATPDKVIKPTDADEGMQQVFNQRLDSLFRDYFKSIFPYADYNSEYRFTFIATAGKIIDYSDMHSHNSSMIKWFEDDFKNQILPSIAKMNFPVKTQLDGNANLEDDFKAKFQGAFMKLEPNEDEQEVYKAKEKSILGDLKYYGPKEIDVPTIYTYAVKYRSTVNSEVWVKKESDDNGTSIYLKDTKEEVSDDLKTKFVLKKIMKKKSTYNIKRCDVFINDQRFRDIMEE